MVFGFWGAILAVMGMAPLIATPVGVALIPLMAHEYLLYMAFVASKIVLRHPKCDASKNVSTPTVSEFDEILRAN